MSYKAVATVATTSYRDISMQLSLMGKSWMSLEYTKRKQISLQMKKIYNAPQVLFGSWTSA